MITRSLATRFNLKPAGSNPGYERRRKTAEKLLRAGVLSSWEAGFVESVSKVPRMSQRQADTWDAICAKRL